MNVKPNWVWCPQIPSYHVTIGHHNSAVMANGFDS